jgi:hypothetical protein
VGGGRAARSGGQRGLRGPAGRPAGRAAHGRRRAAAFPRARPRPRPAGARADPRPRRRRGAAAAVRGASGGHGARRPASRGVAARRGPAGRRPGGRRLRPGRTGPARRAARLPLPRAGAPGRGHRGLPAARRLAPPPAGLARAHLAPRGAARPGVRRRVPEPLGTRRLLGHGRRAAGAGTDGPADTARGAARHAAGHGEGRGAPPDPDGRLRGRLGRRRVGVRVPDGGRPGRRTGAAPVAADGVHGGDRYPCPFRGRRPAGARDLAAVVRDRLDGRHVHPGRARRLRQAGRVAVDGGAVRCPGRGECAGGGTPGPRQHHFEADTDWFHNEIHDYGIAALAPGRRRVAVPAATDTDQAADTGQRVRGGPAAPRPDPPGLHTRPG